MGNTLSGCVVLAGESWHNPCQKELLSAEVTISFSVHMSWSSDAFVAYLSVDCKETGSHIHLTSNLFCIPFTFSKFLIMDLSCVELMTLSDFIFIEPHFAAPAAVSAARFFIPVTSNSK